MLSKKISSPFVLSQVFICFFAITTLGVAAGLILLPVLLSLTGPVRGVKNDDEHERAYQSNSRDNKDDELQERAVGKHTLLDDITDEISV